MLGMQHLRDQGLPDQGLLDRAPAAYLVANSNHHHLVPNILGLVSWFGTSLKGFWIFTRIGSNSQR